MIAVFKNLEDSPVKRVDTVEYSREDKNLYLDIFSSYKQMGIIQEHTTFDDEVWSLKTGVEIVNIFFSYNEVQFQKAIKKGIFTFGFSDLILSMKAYILYMLHSYPSITIYHFATAFRTHLLDKDVLIKRELPSKISDEVFMRYTLYEQYFMFIESYFDNDELLESYHSRYIDYLNRVNKASKDPKVNLRRALPSAETMFKFDEIINDFIKMTDSDDVEITVKRERFLPIIIWWKLTSILPLRPHEIVLTPRECLLEREDGYHLRFYRSNMKGGVLNIRNFDHSFKTCYIEDQCPINRELAMLIQEYLDIISSYYVAEDFYSDGKSATMERNFLFSYRSYRKCMGKNAAFSTPNDIEFFSKTHLNKLLKKFLVEIVQKELGINIIAKSKEINGQLIVGKQLNDIQLMDTRHFAIINMVLLGYEPSTIQRLAGHKTIHQSFHYSNHPQIYTNCYIASIAKEMAFDKNCSSNRKTSIIDMAIDELFGEEGSGNKRFRIVMNTLDETQNHIKLENGTCSYEKKDMLPCKLYAGNHTRCRFFHPYESSLSLINEEFDKISKEVTAELQTLEYLLRKRNVIIGFQQEYSVTVNRLNSRMKNQAEMICNYVFNGIQSEV